MSNTNNIRFNNSNRQFYTEVKKRVDFYFRDNKITKNGNYNMYLKSIFMFSAYFVPYFLLVFNVFDSKLIWLLLAVLMGFSMAGIIMRFSR